MHRPDRKEVMVNLNILPSYVRRILTNNILFNFHFIFHDDFTRAFLFKIVALVYSLSPQFTYKICTLALFICFYFSDFFQIYNFGDS